MHVDVQSGGGRTSGTSLSLIERVRTHDPRAWQRFARIYGPIVYRWAVAMGLQPSDAADVTQEVFAAVAGKLDGFRRDGAGASFRGWLYTIARNKVRDLYRTRAAQPQPVGGDTAQRQLAE